LIGIPGQIVLGCRPEDYKMEPRQTTGMLGLNKLGTGPRAEFMKMMMILGVP
jgi:hypothetical protein